jgi:hypothetical protein
MPGRQGHCRGVQACVYPPPSVCVKTTEYIADSACDACFRLMANPQSATSLAGLAQDPAFQRLVAYARAYYLGEPETVMNLGLAGAAS